MSPTDDTFDIPLERLGGHAALFIIATEAEYGSNLASRFRPLISGVGPVESAVSVGIALQRLHQLGSLPDLVISLGSAGSSQLKQGEVYQVSSVSWRDMDASALGFPKGITPFCDHPLEIPLPTPIADVPSARLSTGADVVTEDGFRSIDAHMVDMETFAIYRACERFRLPLVGLRGISDGDRKLSGYDDWSSMLQLLDERLAEAVDKLESATTRIPSWLSGQKAL